LAAFSSQCSSKLDDFNKEQDFDKALLFGRSCLQSASQVGDTALQRKLDRIALEYSGTAHPFERNLNAIVRLNKLAILAAILALLVDVLVFFTGLYAAKQTVGVLSDNDPVSRNDHERAVHWALGATTYVHGSSLEADGEDEATLKAKVFLSHIEPFPYRTGQVEDPGYWHAIRLESIKDERDKRLCTDVINAYRGFVKTGPENSSYLIRDVMYKHITRLIYEWERGYKHASGEAGSTLASEIAEARNGRDGPGIRRRRRREDGGVVVSFIDRFTSKRRNAGFNLFDSGGRKPGGSEGSASA
jgi:hypothetical protein